VFHLWAQVRDAYLCGVVVFLICLPLVSHYFNLCAWIGLLINPVVLLPMTLALLSGLAVFVLSPFSATLADACGALCSGSLSIMDSLTAWAYQMPGSYLWVTSPGLFWVVLWYLWCLLLVLVPGPQLSRRVRWSGSALILVSAYFFSWPPFPDRVDVPPGQAAMTLTFVDVGHGNAVIMRTPDGQVIVFDAGSFPSARQAGDRIGGVLLAHGIQNIDYLVISHADLDQYNGVPELLRRFAVRHFIGPPDLFADPSLYVQTLKTVVTQSGVPLRWVTAGDRLCQGAGWDIRVVSPPKVPYSDGDNSNSLILEIVYGSARLLLTADVEGQGLRDLLARSHPGYAVVQVPHHGSRHSSPDAFATWAAAPVAVVSASSSRLPATTRAAFEQAGSQVWVTDDVGAVLLAVFDDGRVVSRGYLQRPWATR
jgi:competence protein ComEC